MALAILVPVLRRPHRVAPLLASIAAVTPDPYRVVFVATAGDEEELAAIKSTDAEVLVLAEPYEGRGDYARKINAGVDATSEELIFTGADDLHFHPGWLAAALATGMPVVGTNDLGNPAVLAGRHATHSLVTREYVSLGTIDDPTKLLHEGYPHEWVDREFVETARHRGMFASAQRSIVEHLHPAWAKAPTDALYDGSPARMIAGRTLYRSRRHLWAGA